MYLSKGYKHEVVFILWFCCYLALVAAQDNITDPIEGIFYFSFFWHFMIALLLLGMYLNF
jgi:hypothetical protein